MIDELKQWEYDKGYGRGKADMLKVIEEIRQEITNEAYTKQCFDSNMYDYEDKVIDLGDVYAIIDKYKAESEDA